MTIIRKIGGTQISDTVCSVGVVSGNMFCVNKNDMTPPGSVWNFYGDTGTYFWNGVNGCILTTDPSVDYSFATIGQNVCFQYDDYEGYIFDLKTNVLGITGNTIQLSDNSINFPVSTYTFGSPNLYLEGLLGTVGNVSYGYRALSNITGGDGKNIAIGSCALSANTIGSYNVAMGDGAGYYATGSSSVYIGNQAGYNEILSNRLHIANNAVGSLIYGEFDNPMVRINGCMCISSIPNKTTETSMIYTDSNGKLSKGVPFTYYCIGGGNNNYTCMNIPTSVTTAAYNIFYGNSSGTKITTGSYNVGIGYFAGCSITTGCHNVGIGEATLRFTNTGCWNIGVGWNSLWSNTTGNHNIGIGYSALNLNTVGLANIAIGYRTLCQNTASYNLAMGHCTLYSTTTGGNNTAIGFNAGWSNVSGVNSVFLGYCAGYSETVSNRLHIANNGTGSLIYGEFNTPMVRVCGALCSTTSVYANGVLLTSDCRLKSDIQPITNAMSLINKLDGVCFKFCGDCCGVNQMGLIAQDVEKVIPDMVSHSIPNEYDKEYGIEDSTLGLNYNNLIAVLIEGMKELNKTNAELNNRISQLESQ